MVSLIPSFITYSISLPWKLLEFVKDFFCRWWSIREPKYVIMRFPNLVVNQQ
jgi:hypothetical protein